MEIIKRLALGPAKFEVLKPFYFKPNQSVKPGDIIEIENLGDQAGYCQRGMIKPILPPTAVYIALTTIMLPGRKEKFEAKKLELVELRGVDALPLLLSGSVIPRDDSAWRPFNKRLKEGKK